jgi:hypothetical protein
MTRALEAALVGGGLVFLFAGLWVLVAVDSFPLLGWRSQPLVKVGLLFTGAAFVWLGVALRRERTLGETDGGGRAFTRS